MRFSVCDSGEAFPIRCYYDWQEGEPERFAKLFLTNFRKEFVQNRRRAERRN
jgi:hypothetical protein